MWCDLDVGIVHGINDLKFSFGTMNDANNWIDEAFQKTKDPMSVKDRGIRECS